MTPRLDKNLKWGSRKGSSVDIRKSVEEMVEKGAGEGQGLIITQRFSLPPSPTATAALVHLGRQATLACVQAGQAIYEGLTWSSDAGQLRQPRGIKALGFGRRRQSQPDIPPLRHHTSAVRFNSEPAGVSREKGHGKRCAIPQSLWS